MGISWGLWKQETINCAHHIPLTMKYSNFVSVQMKSKDSFIATSMDTLMHCACVTYNEGTDEIEVGYCVYGCGRALSRSYSNRPNGFSYFGTDKYEWNNISCGSFLRTGTLCGSCMNGSYPPAYSFDVKCLRCINGNTNIWKYLMWAFLPLTVFYLILLLLQINILSSPIFGFVIYSQIVSFPSFIRGQVVNQHDQSHTKNFIRTFEMFYGVWNLDFFRTFNHGFCLEGDNLTILSLISPTSYGSNLCYSMVVQ